MLGVFECERCSVFFGLVVVIGFWGNGIICVLMGFFILFMVFVVKVIEYDVVY
jgi:hypothetical protein